MIGQRDGVDLKGRTGDIVPKHLLDDHVSAFARLLFLRYSPQGDDLTDRSSI